MTLRKDGIESIARVNAARGIFAALPGIWTRSWTEERLAPKIACTSVKPSLPTVAISMIAPSAYTATTETTPLSGKKTWSSALSASIRTCARWQLICSRSVISRLRLRGGSASKSRLRGQFDKAFTAIRSRSVRLRPVTALPPALDRQLMRPKRKSPDEGARGARGLSGLSNGSRLSYFWFNCLLHRQHALFGNSQSGQNCSPGSFGPAAGAETHTQDCLGRV